MRWTWIGLGCCVLGLSACCSKIPDAELLVQRAANGGLVWDPSRAEMLSWHSRDPAFSQERALEASGLAASDHYLYVVAEKYFTLLQLDPEADFAATAIRLDVPLGAELEGVAWSHGEILMCDEAHAAVYAVTIDEAALARGELESPVPIRKLALPDLGVEGGKVGFEGIAVSSDGGVVYLLLERQGNDRCGCWATVFALQRVEDRLELAEPPMSLPLASCNWRLADLVMFKGALLAIQSQYPGERYRVLEIDPRQRSTTLAFDMTAMGRSLRPQGYGNNLEGMTVAADGWLYVVGDNADVPQAAGHVPPPTDEVTPFLRMPPANHR